MMITALEHGGAAILGIFIVFMTLRSAVRALVVPAAHAATAHLRRVKFASLNRAHLAPAMHMWYSIVVSLPTLPRIPRRWSSAVGAGNVTPP